MKLAMLEHHHRHGVDTYLGTFEGNPSDEEVEKAFMEKCSIDFEPNREGDIEPEFVELTYPEIHNLGLKK